MKNIRNGYYLRYDGRLICVVDTVKSIDTGEQLVLCRFNAPKTQHLYAVSRRSFLESTEVDGKKVPKYRHISQKNTFSEEDADAIYASEGEYPPEKLVKGRKSSKHRPARTYKAYAKDLSESYLRDVRIARGGTSAGQEGDARAKENVSFLEQCLAGELEEYADYFRERFIEGKSIRKYAEEHGINRGSVDYIQLKFFRALAKCLEKRDREENRCRLEATPQPRPHDRAGGEEEG